MDCKLSRKIQILSSMCDEDLKLSLPAAMDIFQDTAGIHASMFGIGAEQLKDKGMFWVVSKTRLCVNRLPGLLDKVTASTWVQPTERVSCERDFSITDGEETMVYARSIWAVLERDTDRLVHMKDIYPDMDFLVPPPDEKRFMRVSKDFAGCDEIGSYTVRSIDIDNGGHMNNVHYLRAAMGCFSNKDIRSKDIKEIDMQFLAQCYEGDTIRFYRRNDATSGIEIGAINDDNKLVFTGAIIT